MARGFHDAHPKQIAPHWKPCIIRNWSMSNSIHSKQQAWNLWSTASPQLHMYLHISPLNRTTTRGTFACSFAACRHSHSPQSQNRGVHQKLYYPIYLLLGIEGLTPKISYVQKSPISSENEIVKCHLWNDIESRNINSSVKLGGVN